MAFLPESNYLGVWKTGIPLYIIVSTYSTSTKLLLSFSGWVNFPIKFTLAYPVTFFMVKVLFVSG